MYLFTDASIDHFSVDPGLLPVFFCFFSHSGTVKHSAESRERIKRYLICHSSDKTCCHSSQAPCQTRVTNCNYVVFLRDGDERPHWQQQQVFDLDLKSFVNPQEGNSRAAGWSRTDDVRNKNGAGDECNRTRNEKSASVWRNRITSWEVATHKTT